MQLRRYNTDKGVFELCKDARERFKRLGHIDKDMRQLCDAVATTKYYLNDSIQLTADEAYDMLGESDFMSGLSRSAFHFSSVRECNEGAIFFDSSALFD